eukprot:COSAG05_NODE_41_length_26845_cov_26.599230_13_plen_57_part_00
MGAAPSFGPVLSTVNDGAPVGATLKQYGISKDCMNKHRTALTTPAGIQGEPDISDE